MNQPILVFRTGHLGDTLASLPAIRRIRRLHPQSKLYLVTEKPRGGMVSAWDVLKETGYFEDVFFYDAGLNFANLPGFASLAMKIRGLAPEAVFYLSQNKSADSRVKRDRFFFQTVCGIRHGFGFRPVRFPARVAGNMPRVALESNRLLASIGEPDAAASDHLLDLPAEKDKWAKMYLNFAGVTSKNYLVFGPGSKMQSKRWPVESFIAAGKKLLETNPGLSLLILGGGEDREAGEKMVSALGNRVFNFAGKFSVIESAAILKRSAGYVGNDTGTMHLASAVGKPCVAIFSARDYRGLWEPAGRGHTIIRKEIPCSGCMLETCVDKKNECLTSISVDEVVEAAAKLLK